MRIFFTNTAPIIKYGIGQAFNDKGHETYNCNILLEGDWQHRLEQFKPDYVFTDGGWGIIEILMPYLLNKKIPHIYWAIEDPPFFEVLSLPFARCSNYVFTTCQNMIPRYELYGIKAGLLPFGCHPHWHKKGKANPKYAHDLIFLGNNYDNFPERNAAAGYILQPLISKGYNIKIYGNDWWLDKERPFSIEPSIYGGFAPVEDLGDICAGVPIVLGLHSVVNSATMMSMRTFEILGCSGFFLTQWTPALEHYFSNHQHLVWTKSEQETLELVNYYLAHPEERARIALQGQQEVYKNHTYHQRVDTILSQLSPEFENTPHLDKEITNYRITRKVFMIGK